MCYIIITTSSLVWFLLTLIADMLIITAIVTPKWLIAPRVADTLQHIQQVSVYTSLPPPLGPQANYDDNNVHQEVVYHEQQHLTSRSDSVGIYTRCKMMYKIGYHCGPFDLDGFATDSNVYPNEWKAAMFFISLGFVLLSGTVILTLLTCCRQSAFGKSIHNMTACVQVVSGISVMLALFLHPLGWGAQRVQRLCGPDAEPFYPGACNIGTSFYSALASIVLTFICAGISLKAESSNMRTRVRRRVEEGGKLVCIP